MKLRHYLLAALICLIMGETATAAEKTKKVYMYGIAISFNDSTIYLTEIQAVDSAVLTNKGHFLYGRDSYSYQLRDYLKGKGFNAPTCVTTFATKQKDIEKRFISTKKRYANGKYTLKHVTPGEFKFTAITLDDNDGATSKEDRKAIKKKTKAEKKEKANKSDMPKGPRHEGPHPNGRPEGHGMGAGRP